MINNKLLLSFILSLIIFLSSTIPILAATITVSSGQSIQSAANSANSGDTVTVSAGTYNETVSVSRPGITFQANGSVTTKGFYITGNNTTVTGFTVNDTPSYGIEVSGSNSIIKNNTVTRGKNSGFMVSGQNHLIENNDVSKIVQPKSHSSGGDANCFTFFGSGHIFRGNYCHDISNDGILASDAHIDGFQTWNWGSMGGVGHDILFEKNVMIYPDDGKIWNIEDGAYNITIKNNITLSGLISLFTYTKNLTLINNTFVGNGSGADGHHVRQTTVHASNNIFAYFQGSYGDFENLESSSTITGSNNCYYQTNRRRSADSRDIIGQNPLFVNESARDYRLQANSPCLGTGAYEYGGGSSLPKATPRITLTSTPAQPTSTRTPTPTGISGWNSSTTTLSPTTNDADIDDNGKVNIIDYTLFMIGWWLKNLNTTDLNDDGKISVIDYTIFMNGWYDSR